MNEQAIMYFVVCIPEDNSPDGSFFTRWFKTEQELSDWVNKEEDNFPANSMEKLFNVEKSFCSAFKIVEGNSYPQPVDQLQYIKSWDELKED